MGTERRFTRRRVLGGSAAIAVTGLTGLALKDIPEQLVMAEISKYRAETFSHNADSIQQIKSSVGVAGIEMDLTQLDPTTLVVTHSPEDYRLLPPEAQQLQDPHHIASTIRDQGARVHVDVKNVLDPRPIISFIKEQEKYGPVSVSTPLHDFLWELSESGFDGQTLFTLPDQATFDQFIKITPTSTLKKSFGVSIRHEVLSIENSQKLKDMGLYILTWTPNSPTAVLRALKNGADGITSDKIDLLHAIGQTAVKNKSRGL